MHTLLFLPVAVYGWTALVLGICCWMVVTINRINRRSAGGVQQYRSAIRGMVTYPVESLIKIIGVLLIVAGLFFIALDSFNKHMANKYHRAKAAAHARR